MPPPHGRGPGSTMTRLAFSLAFCVRGEIQAEQVEDSLLNGGWFGENRNRQCIVEAHGVACEVGQIGQ
jgi:hypothetical protein